MEKTSSARSWHCNIVSETWHLSQSSLCYRPWCISRPTYESTKIGKNSHFQQTASCVSWNAKWESAEWSPLPSLLWHRHTRNGPRCEPPKGRHRVSTHVTWYRSKSNVRYLQCLKIRKLVLFKQRNKRQRIKNFWNGFLSESYTIFSQVASL